MFTRIFAGLTLAVVTIVLTGSVSPVFAMKKQVGTMKQSGSKQLEPGPIAGAGLPIFAIGYGAYCLVKRRRQQASW
jgi:hypothetical protein